MILKAGGTILDKNPTEYEVVPLLSPVVIGVL